MKILLVEDNAAFGESLKEGLEDLHWTVDWARDGQEGLFLAERSHYQILLLDEMLPRLSGLELLASLRQKKIFIPTITLSARSGLDERVRALEQGADDFLAKPFEMRELKARIEALYRRTQAGNGQVYVYGPLAVDPQSRTVRLGDQILELTAKEFDLIEVLVQKPEMVLSRQQIVGLLYPYEDEPESNSLDVLLARIRRKLQDSKVEITTMRGRGFVLRIKDAVPKS